MTADVSRLALVFVTVFLAELGDKTQVATLAYATDRELAPLWVFVAASAALVASTGLAVLLGSTAGAYLQSVPIKAIAGVAFILIGCWTLWEYLQG